MGAEAIRASERRSHPGFVISYFCEQIKILTLSFCLFLCVSKRKSKRVEDKITQAFPVTCIQKLVVSTHPRARAHTCTPLLGVVMMGTWERRQLEEAGGDLGGEEAGEACR